MNILEQIVEHIMDEALERRDINKAKKLKATKERIKTSTKGTVDATKGTTDATTGTTDVVTGTKPKPKINKVKKTKVVGGLKP